MTAHQASPGLTRAIAALRRNGWHAVRAADALGIHHSTLHRIVLRAEPEGTAFRDAVNRHRDQAARPNQRSPHMRQTKQAGADLSSISAALAALAEAQKQQGQLISQLLSAREAPPPPPVRTAIRWTPPEPDQPSLAWDNSSILTISDPHSPYHHPDIMPFLAALHRAYQFSRIVCTGDETDGHGISFHKSNPDLPSAGHETELAREFMADLHDLFPVMSLCDSNHGSLIYRRQMDGGLPARAMQSYRGFLFGEVQKDGSVYFHDNRGAHWTWANEHTAILPNGEEVLWVHGYCANSTLAAQKAGRSVVQGHYHSTFKLEMLQGARGLSRFGITGGCLVDPKSLAMAYGKTFVLKPIIGCSGILDSVPVMFPMPLTAKGRWTGKLPDRILTD